MEYREIALPIVGINQISTANVLATSLVAEAGVLHAELNVASETILIRYDAGQLETCDLAYLVREAGFEVPEMRYAIVLKGLNCLSCVARVEGALSEVPGVLKVDVNLRKSTAEIRLVASTTNETELASILKKAGYELVGMEMIR